MLAQVDPYAPPTDESAPPPAQSTALLVLGVFQVVVGALGLLSGPFALVSRAIAKDPVTLRLRGITETGVFGVWSTSAVVLGVGVSGLLLGAGIGVILHRPWGRRLSRIYGLSAIALDVVGQAMAAVYMYPALLAWIDEYSGNPPGQAAAVAGLAGGIVGGILGLVLPIVTLIVMSRPKVRARFGA